MALRYSASLHLAVNRRIAEVVAEEIAKHPHRDGPEMEVCFYPVDHIRPPRFTLVDREDDEQPVAASGVAEED